MQVYGEEAWRAAGTPSDRSGTVIGVGAVAVAAEWGRRRPVRRAGGVGRNGRLGLSAQAISTQRQRLLQKEIIDSAAHNIVAFAVPGFGRYVSERAHPA